MRQLTAFRKILLALAFLFFTVIGAAYAKISLAIPDEMVLIEGEEYNYHIKSILPISIKTDKEGILQLDGKTIASTRGSMALSRPAALSTTKGGKVKLNLKFFGIVPAKTVNINIVPKKQVVACGNTIGVRMELQGILVIGISDVEREGGQKAVPAKNTGLKPGVIITSVNGKTIKSIKELVGAIDESQGKPLKLSYYEGNAKRETSITPVMSTEDKKYHIGLWVRDSTAGIGTLTFYDKDTRLFGALGHGITDIDTGTLMKVGYGEILESSVLGVKSGRSGEPGELKGIFSEGTRLGTIELNSDTGIYGKLDEDVLDKIGGRVYPVGVRADITEGEASILSNIDGKKTEEYSIEIQKISNQNLNGSKGMVIKVTDSRLLDVTGGIVQGMSGSPIIQNGKIIGAVTHVLVNDPTRGYGIFIEAMLKNIGS